jgi:hypothetical protein
MIWYRYQATDERAGNSALYLRNRKVLVVGWASRIGKDAITADLDR